MLEQLQSSSTFTFARALFHAAEGEALFEQRFVFASAVATYYALFHLGTALILAYCSTPSTPNDPFAPTRKILEDKWAKRQPRMLSDGRQYLSDPAQYIDHKDVPPFLEQKLPELGQSLGRRDQRGTLRDLREFSSYAPRMVSVGQSNVLYSGCQYTAQDFESELSKYLRRMDQFFSSAAAWLAKGYTEIYWRLLSGDFVLFEFAELRTYHPDPVAKRAWEICVSLCNQVGVDWATYRSDPTTFHTDERGQRTRYAEVVESLR